MNNNAKKILLMAIVFSLFSCDKENNLEKNFEVKKTISLEQSAEIRNTNLKRFAKNISELQNFDVYKKISSRALEKYDGDKDFIYHKDKEILGERILADIEKGIDREELNNPYLNIYVYNPYNDKNKLKPYVFYFPVGQKDTEVNKLIGFFDGKEIQIDAKNPPSDIKNPIFVIGENERISEVEKNTENSFAINDKTFCVNDEYKNNTDFLSRRGGDGNKMRVTYSRFTSMSNKRKYEPWGKGDAEIRFIFTKAVFYQNYTKLFPETDLSVKVSSSLIDGGYIKQPWGFGGHTIGNYTKTNYFVDFDIPTENNKYNSYELTTPQYFISVIEEDRYWGWVSKLFNLTEKNDISFLNFKMKALTNLKVRPENIKEPSVREIYYDMLNASNIVDFKRAFNKINKPSEFYFNTSKNNYIKSEFNVKKSLLFAGVALIKYTLEACQNTDDVIDDKIVITKENGKIYYSSDGAFKFKLEY